MIRGIGKNEHGFTDYSYIPLTAAAPRLLHFENEKWASGLCYALSATVLGYSLLTDAKWGVIKLIPYKTHAALDFSMGVVALSAPLWLPEKPGRMAGRALLVIGLTGLVVGTLSLLGARRQP